jgi:hypothetical protein
VYSQLFKDCLHAERWQDKFLIWFKRTGWRPDDVEQNYPLSKVDLTQFRKFDIPLSLINKCYSLLQYLLVLFIGFLILMNAGDFTLVEQLLVVVFVLYSSVSVGLVLENNPTAIYLEWIKLSLIMVTLMVYTLPIWIEWSLGVSILINGTLLLLKKKDIINTTRAMMKV